MKSVVFTPASTRQWGKLAADVRRRIDGRLIELATSGKGDVKRLKGRKGSRLRVGDWRVIFYEEGGAIVIVAVGHRREIYD
jgi:mRNA interferase RelE/StbE